MSSRVAILSEVCEVNPKTPKITDDDAAVSFLPMSAVSENGYIDFEEERRLAEVKKGYTYFERGDVLVAKITPCFENGKATETRDMKNKIGFGSTEFHVLRASEELHPRYLFYFVWNERFRYSVAKGMTGSAGQKRVPADLLKRTEIPLPPLNEQRRIAAILDKADSLRQKRKHAIALLDGLTQSIFLEMFGDLTASSNKFDAGVVGDWVADFSTGKNLAPDPDNTNASSYRVLKVSAVTKGVFDPSESKPLHRNYRPPESHIVQDGDLLFSRANTAQLVGATALVRGKFESLVLPDKIWRFEWQPTNEPNPIFVRGLFSTPKFRNEISKRATGTSGSMKNISKQKVLGIPVQMPPRNLQDRYAAQAERTQRAVENMIEQASGFDQSFTSLQHRAFAGEL